MVVIRKCADPQIDAGQIKALAGTQLSAHNHLAAHLGTFYFPYFYLNIAVIQKQSIARLHRFGKPGEAYRNACGITDDIFGCEGKRITGL
jgi:hypothetical protein